MEPRADTPWNKFRKQVLRLLDEPDSSLAAYVFKYAMLFTIITAVTLMLLNTLPRYDNGNDYYDEHNSAFMAWELVFNIVFLVEFIVRVAVGEEHLRTALPPHDTEHHRSRRVERTAQRGALSRR